MLRGGGARVLSQKARNCVRLRVVLSCVRFGGFDMHSRSLGLPRLLFALLGTLLIFGGSLTPAQNSGRGFELHANGNARAADVGLPLYPRSKLFKSVDIE